MSAVYARIHQPRALDFSEDQEAAVDRIDYWRGQWPKARQMYTCGGWAGCGKTTVIAHLARVWPNTAVAAFCGKAAHVLRSKGVEASTIHGLIYAPFENDEGKVCYRKRKHLNDIETIIIDEASMVDHVLHQDLLAFGLPILYVGDHGQLEPIGTNPGLMKNPDIRLEKIHRQHADNPIIRLAAAFREGRKVPYWSDPKGRAKIVPRREYWSMLSPEYQVICGFNKTRHAINKRIREMLHFEGQLPVRGERIICKQNNRESGIFNGQMMIVRKVGRVARKTVRLTVETDDERLIEISCLIEQFGKDSIKDHRDKSVALADFGYCLTTHAAQGSGFAKIMVVEEIMNSWNPARWRYTAVTRAEQEAIYCM